MGIEYRERDKQKNIRNRKRERKKKHDVRLGGKRAREKKHCGRKEEKGKRNKMIDWMLLKKAAKLLRKRSGERL